MPQILLQSKAGGGQRGGLMGLLNFILIDIEGY